LSHIFPFVTSQPNPIGGCASGNYWGDEGYLMCGFDCVYCWAKAMKNHYKYPKYQGPWRLYPSAMKVHGADEFPWACDMIDIGDPTIPFKPVLFELFRWVGSQPCPVLLLTKNPIIYRIYRNYIPENAVVGATIESDDPARLLRISKAPSPWRRLDDMHWCAHNLPNKRFVCVEPAVKFSDEFADRILEVEPWAVAVGYDGYNNHLPEPTLDESEGLINQLENSGIQVFRKRIRRAWDEI